jgi:hypothetical protein
MNRDVAVRAACLVTIREFITIMNGPVNAHALPSLSRLSTHTLRLLANAINKGGTVQMLADTVRSNLQ